MVEDRGSKRGRSSGGTPGLSTSDDSQPITPGSISAARTVLEVLAAALLFLLMTITVIDVVGRYVLGKPLPGSAEISAIVLALFVFASLPLVNLRREHIIVDLFSFSSGSIPERATRYLATAVTAGSTLWVAFEVAQLALDLARHGDTTSFLRIPYAPVAVFMALTCLVAGLFSLGGAAPLDKETALGLDDDTDDNDATGRADGTDIAEGTATRRARATE